MRSRRGRHRGHDDREPQRGELGRRYVVDLGLDGCYKTSMSNRSRVLCVLSIVVGVGWQAGVAKVGHAQSVLPRPEPAFRGKVGKTFHDSRPDFPATVTAPKGAPNVLLVILDDVGFGHAKTFGGVAETPTMDRLARAGVRYNTFHTTALCSPTRAALLTGRNHHSVSTGIIIEMGTGFPGYTGAVPDSTVAIAEILRQNGYATAAFGKWHNTPDHEVTPTGPFDRWPTGRVWGFEYFYGFMNGETNQYFPVLYRNTTQVAAPRTPEQGYHFGQDMTDEALAWMQRVKAVDSSKPWFMYYAPGGIHAPHHAPKAYRDKYKGRLDMGWDAYREQVWRKQMELGWIPAGTKLTPRPKNIPSWDSQPEEAKRVYRRLAENYSAYLEYTDVQVGRVVDAIAEAGELDNTLIVYIVGDNGASAEGGLQGTPNEVASLNGIQLGLAGLQAQYDQIGGPTTAPHIPVAWAWAMNTPFQWTKQVASHFGGTRNPMIVHWPKKVSARGELRSQFHHVIDVVPTVLEAAGIQAPSRVNGVAQKPIEGVSMAYTFEAGAANRPGRRTSQYFEMFGNRAMYHDGWIASVFHRRAPWETGVGAQGDFQNDAWELYNLRDDFSQATDLAARNPSKLRELQALFDRDAKKFQVYPLDDRMAERMASSLRPSPSQGRTRFVYRQGASGIPENVAPDTKRGAHTITVNVTMDQSAQTHDGVLVALGGESAGWSLYLQHGKPTYLYNFFGEAHYKVQAPQPLPKGKHAIRVDVTPTAAGAGAPRRVVMSINGRQVATGTVQKSVPFRYGLESFDVGMDLVSPVSVDYRSPHAFKGSIDQVQVDVRP